MKGHTDSSKRSPSGSKTSAANQHKILLLNTTQGHLFWLLESMIKGDTLFNKMLPVKIPRALVA